MRPITNVEEPAAFKENQPYKTFALACAEVFYSACSDTVAKSKLFKRRDSVQ
jgi:hypothetical protein